MTGSVTPPGGGLRHGDVLWGLGLFATIGFLLWRNFAGDGGSVPKLALGPLRLSIFGALAVLDLLFAIYLIKRWCERFDLDWPKLASGLPWIILIGYYISHLTSIAFYYPQDMTDPWALLDTRTRISSFGGIFGGALVAILFFKRHGLPVWRYCDPLALGFIGGYIFGRAGCFAIHDHPGLESEFFLAINIDGVQRHDLGFYEMWLMLGLCLVILFISRHTRPPDGFVVALFATIYAPIRFLLDFLRVGDITYASLTPGQWMAILLFFIGVWGWRDRNSKPHKPDQ